MKTTPAIKVPAPAKTPANPVAAEEPKPRRRTTGRPGRFLRRTLRDVLREE